MISIYPLLLPTLQRPRHPFHSWEPQRTSPAFGHAFRLQRGVLATQSTVEACTTESIDFVVGCVDAILRHDETEGLGGITILHDWRSFRSYESPARTRLFEAMRERPKGYARRIAIAVPATPFWRMAVSGAAVVYAFLRVSAPELITDAGKLLPHPGMRPTAPPPWFTGAK